MHEETTKLRRPCANYPWRVDAPREYWDSSHFVSIWANCQGDSMGSMGCHKSASLPKPTPCQGWIRVMGFASIGVRLLAMTGVVTFDEVNDKGGPKLFRTFAAMLRANKIPVSRIPRFKP